MTPDTPENFSVDLTNCDREPIHKLGRVQSYGALIAVSTDWIVQHASENLNDILGVAHEDALGQPLQAIIVSDAFDRIRKHLRAIERNDGVLRLFAITLRDNGKSFDVSIHESGRHLIIEFEPKVGYRGRDVMTDVYPHIASLSRDQDLRALTHGAARGLQELSGFDSVMVYQFQPDGSGKVVAESRSDNQSKYDGLMFPASDIPKQARALYKRSLLRLIADVDDPGSVITPGKTIEGEPIDLSLAVTRSVSPIHIEYLKNMGIQASMSVSIMKEGELWGLFACHHHTPRFIDYERRTALEMYAHMFSYELGRFEDTQRKKAEQNSSRLQSLLMAHMADERPLAESLLAVSEEIRSVIPHDALLLVQDDEIHATRNVLSNEELRSITRFLDVSIGATVFSIDELSRLHEPARNYSERVAGILAIPISRRPRDYLVLTRKQVVESVSWAGDPNKPVTPGPNGDRLTPRKSFETWRETVSGRSAPWLASETHAAELLRVALLEVFLKVADSTSRERQRAHEHQQLLISELNHRVRNILNLMRGLLAQSRSSARTLEEFSNNLDGRVQALARAHDQLTAEQWEPASLKSLIACEFEAYANKKSQRVSVTGPDALIVPSAYTTMALVLHELATNSIKYGALCDQAGRVEINLKSDSNGGLLVDWREHGGPPVHPPKRRGFGTVIIEDSIPHELNGDASVSYKMTGLQAHFRLPSTNIADFVDDTEAHFEVVAEQTPTTAKSLSGRGLVLEDTLIIAMDAAAILEELGASTVQIKSSVASAMEWLETHEIEFALLDVNLGQEQSVAVAEALYQRGVPFVVATGYGATEELTSTYPPCVIVQKPFSKATLQEAFASTFERLAEKGQNTSTMQTSK